MKNPFLTFMLKKDFSFWYNECNDKGSDCLRKLIFKILFLLFIIGLVVVSIFLLMGHTRYNESLEEKPLDEYISEIKERENYTKLDEVPKIYLDAVVAVEDHRFYDHNGVDLFSLARAVFVDVTTKELSQGGSTITQQLAKNLYFEMDTTATRKIAEGFLANELEKKYSKDEILELYINTAYYGDGYYSVKEASRGYFGKEPIEMTDSEATLLAGVPNAPSVYAPTQNMDLAKKRQTHVVESMVKYDYLSQEEANKILK